MQLNPTEISELIKSRIEQFEVVSEARTEGTIVSLSDGIARIHGLADAMQGEMLEFPGNVFGMAWWIPSVIPLMARVRLRRQRLRRLKRLHRA
jgi:F0F1-type ATP synthase alpha subunit